MMGLRHDMVVGQFDMYGGSGRGGLKVIDRGGQWPGVGCTSAVYGRVIMKRVECGAVKGG